MTKGLGLTRCWNCWGEKTVTIPHGVDRDQYLKTPEYRRKTSEFLTKAKDVIETDGWIQGDLFNAKGVCSEGAMQFAAIHHMTPGWHEGRKALRDKIYEIYGELSISRWNDEPGRTKREVLEVFEKTIIGLEERGQ